MLRPLNRGQSSARLGLRTLIVMGPGMAADVTAFIDRIVAAAKIVGIEIDQVSIGRSCGPGNQGHAVGIVTEKTGCAMADKMTAMTGKCGLLPIEQDIRVVATKTERIIALGIAQGINLIFITGQ